MEPYIKKADIVAEIDRIKKEECPIDSYEGRCKLLWFEQFLSFINTLEVKEINNVWNNVSDFPKAEAGRSILLIEDNGHAELLKSPSAERLFYFRSANLKMWAYVDELLSITTHFEVKEVDLKAELNTWRHNHFHGGRDFEASGEYLERITQLELAKHFLELGLNSQRKISYVPNIDDSLKELGVDPDSKEAKIFKESYYTALEKLKAQKGE